MLVMTMFVSSINILLVSSTSYELSLLNDSFSLNVLRCFFGGLSFKCAMPRLGKVLKFGIICTVLSTLVIFSMQFAKYEPAQDSEGLPIKEHLNHVKMNVGSRLSEENLNEYAEADIPPANDKVDGVPLLYEKQFDTGEKDLSEEDLPQQAKLGNDISSNPNVHAFYYAWFGNPGKDGEYIHWNHPYLPHWNAKISAQYPTGQRHQPPEDIGASFYPLLGPYSSLDESITRTHMLQLQQAGIGVLALSWYPPGQADDNGKPMEDYVQVIFDIAEEFNIKVCFHIEPYPDRDSQSVRKNIEYIINTYGDHPAFYRHHSVKTGRMSPLIYLYDSYLIKPAEWQRLFTQEGDISIRDSEYDCFAIGLLVDEKQQYAIKSSGFDGMYTYFAVDGFSYGSTRTKWNDIATFAARTNLLFIPSVGPGYDDTRVRPWNKGNSRDRQDGAYYESGWQTAASCNGVDIISITSFNEWHEGTQIEPASDDPEQGSFPYLTYGSKGPNFYLQLTKKWSDLWMTSHNVL